MLSFGSSCASLVTPFQCRLRDCTYSAPLWVNVRYTRGRQIVNKTNINIGRIPVMLLRCTRFYCAARLWRREFIAYRAGRSGLESIAKGVVGVIRANPFINTS